MQRAKEIIIIGGSAGSYVPILDILDAVPPTISQALCFIIHRNPKYESQIESSLSARLKRKVISTMDKTPIEPNHIYFAPPGYHMLIEPDLSFSLDTSEPVNYSRPSIDVLFESAAEIYRKNCTVVLLSGANNDGSNGIKKVLKFGGKALVQCPQEAHINTMPGHALRINPAAIALSNEEIISYFRQL